MRGSSSAALSVAICTWNRAALLRQTLRRLSDVAPSARVSWELIVVNNNCTDDTDTVLEDFKGRLPLRRIFEGTPGLSNARNSAIAAARGRWILFTDDDVLVSNHWLDDCAAGTQTFPDAAAIGGRIEPWFPVEPDADLCQAFPFLRIGFCGLDYGSLPRLLEPHEDLYGANLGFRLGAIEGLRFDPRLGVSAGSAVVGEETDFVRRLRARGDTVVWWPAMQVRHYIDPSRMTRDYLLHFSVGHGTTQVLVGPPDEQSRRLFGVPHWLWRKYLQASCRARLPALARHIQAERSLHSGAPPRPDAPPRVRALVWQREQAFLKGMIEGYRRRDRSETA